MRRSGRASIACSAEDGAVLYVGKAKSLRKRVASYTRLAGHTNRIARMIALTASMVFVSTRTEAEALLLEANLIKQMKPRFNVLLRDDKSFPYILLTQRRARRAADQASRRAQPQGRLFRPLRQRLGGQPHAQRAAARLPAALLRKFLLRQPHAALPAVPDQALRRPLHGGSLGATIMPNWRARRATSWPANRARCARCWRAR